MLIEVHIKKLHTAFECARLIVQELKYRRYKALGHVMQNAREIMKNLEEEIERSLNEMPPLDRRDMGFMQARQQIRAIKSYRERTGVGLLVSKWRTDQAKNGIVFQLSLIHQTPKKEER